MYMYMYTCIIHVRCVPFGILVLIFLALCLVYLEWVWSVDGVYLYLPFYEATIIHVLIHVHCNNM